MVNVLNKISFIYLIFLINISLIINSSEIFSSNNITTNINEQQVNVQYETKTIQDGKINSMNYINISIIIFRIYCSICWLL